jgi:SAM-dependent methyltransferase
MLDHDDGPLSTLIGLYAAAHRPLPNLAQDDVDYMSGAQKRERWTVEFMLNAIGRYGTTEDNHLALDAGCGSGGSLPWLAERFLAVAGVDPDLPAMLIASRRCRDASVSDKVVLVAATLEQRVFQPETFDAIKCTDVIEHVKSPTHAVLRMAESLRPRGAAYVLTPNKWNLLAREPHVKLWGIQLLPRAPADHYCRQRLGIAYSNVSRLLSSRQLHRTLLTPVTTVRFVPIEDKHLNPRTRRGQILKGWFAAPPLRWISRAIRPLQPVLEAMLIR